MVGPALKCPEGSLKAPVQQLVTYDVLCKSILYYLVMLLKVCYKPFNGN